ncbi:helicase-related protein [Dietzia sp. B32]|uniref:helicase-related protein n=1 Tax=Dietzia sp. B32 TaxID=2915130 RepID=UPI0021ADEAC4|nr:helicase-related protein [Dietzia sp. B32]UVE94405.1 hypothetical protein L8M95_12820 [Dietzia sp. B32]
MTLTQAQHAVLAHLRSAYLGPDGGPEEILTNRPTLQYSVGILFPREEETPDEDGSPTGVHDEVTAEVGAAGEVEETGATVPIAADWRPSSVAISFITNRPEVDVRLAGATYKAIEDGGPPRWERHPFEFNEVKIARGGGPMQLAAGDVPIELGARWRDTDDWHLVTVHTRVLAPASGNDRIDALNSLFQVSLEVRASAGGVFEEYNTTRALELDDESAELRLRYRNRRVYAVGHGMAADWDADEQVCTRVWLEPVPAHVVPAIETVGFPQATPQAEALKLQALAQIDTSRREVIDSLEAFVGAFATWVSEQEERVAGFGTRANIASRIVERSVVSLERMRKAVEMLDGKDQHNLRTAFSLAMRSMRLQMLRNSTGEPRWRPFQLGFLLVSLASTTDERHHDRELVDLIWFPTGGGKTEAYLGLAAIEIFRRRLEYGAGGGGTAVITRYTLRLLTAQQFQRASALICSMELLRRPGPHSDPLASKMAPFSIGLWVGNEVTPGTVSEGKAALDRLYKAANPEEANQFQVESCPWCDTPLLPASRSHDRSAYGVKLIGRELIIHCTNSGCEFYRELPLKVVDEALYADPPTILLATVDKFARLQFKPEAGRLLGLDTGYRQPSLIIQDELHLLSGPLGTTVAVFDAVLQLLLSAGGSAPKIVASTATIRASEDQTKGLYGRKVALYPPSGLDEDRTFFSRPVKTGEGRLYVGLMPQALSQVSAMVSAASPLLEIPEVLTRDSTVESTRDAYWTAVMYHNSLRELGRTGTLVVDDVNARLIPRAERLGIALRTVRAGRVLELTSRRGPAELPNDLRELKKSVDHSKEAIDVVLSSNMLSVGIDIPRLALMLMVGQPKTTAEYIQATSRVGRGEVRGVVTTLFRSNRARDRSHFETFRGYHETLYRNVEPTSVTPWSLASRERSLAGALVALVRLSAPTLSGNSSAIRLDLREPGQKSTITALVQALAERVCRADEAELEDTVAQLWALVRDWDRRSSAARAAGEDLYYDRNRAEDKALLKRFGQSGEGWLVADSMRSVEPNVSVEIREPHEEGKYGTNQA